MSHQEPSDADLDAQLEATHSDVLSPSQGFTGMPPPASQQPAASGKFDATAPSARTDNPLFAEASASSDDELPPTPTQEEKNPVRGGPPHSMGPTGSRGPSPSVSSSGPASVPRLQLSGIHNKGQGKGSSQGKSGGSPEASLPPPAPPAHAEGAKGESDEINVQSTEKLDDGEAERKVEAARRAQEEAVEAVTAAKEEAARIMAEAHAASEHMRNQQLQVEEEAARKRAAEEEVAKSEAAAEADRIKKEADEEAAKMRQETQKEIEREAVERRAEEKAALAEKQREEEERAAEERRVKEEEDDKAKIAQREEVARQKELDQIKAREEAEAKVEDDARKAKLKADADVKRTADEEAARKKATQEAAEAKKKAEADELEARKSASAAAETGEMEAGKKRLNEEQERASARELTTLQNDDQAKLADKMPPMPLPGIGMGGGKGKGGKGLPGGKGMPGGKGGKGKGKGGLGALRVPQGPPSKTKGVFWNTLSHHAAAESVWGSMEDVSQDYDVDDIEKQFAKKKSAPKKSEDQLAEDAKRKAKEKTSMIDSNRSRNIEIMLSTMKLTHEDIASALASYDKNHFFSASQITSLQKYIPTEADKEKLLGFAGEDGRLSKADRFMRALSAIPRMAEKLEAMSFRNAFEAEMGGLKKLVHVVTQASNQIKSSKKLTKVLEYILALGNHLNKGTARGQATGFKLDGLLKFTETKGVDQSTTLLHYLCSTVSTKSPDLLTFPEDLVTVKQAAKMTFNIITSNLQELQAGTKRLELEATHAEAGTGIGDFAVEARAHVSQIEADVVTMNHGVAEVSQYFGEAGRGGEPEEPFRIMDQFIDSFVKARSDVEKAKQLKDDKAKRLAARQAQKKGVVEKSGGPTKRGPMSPKSRSPLDARSPSKA